MLKKLLAALTVAAVCFGPATVLLSVAVLVNPAVAACAGVVDRRADPGLAHCDDAQW